MAPRLRTHRNTFRAGYHALQQKSNLQLLFSTVTDWNLEVSRVQTKNSHKSIPAVLLWEFDKNYKCYISRSFYTYSQ